MGSEVDRAWSGAEYAAHTAHHRRHDPDALRALTLRPGQRLLDLGCGVGELAADFATRFPAAEVLGLDAAPDMIAAARERVAPNLEFAVVRAQDLDYESGFDAVISTACLHWVPATDHPRVLAAVHRALRAGGRFVAEFGGAGNVSRTLDIIVSLAAEPPFAAHVGAMGNPWYFPSAGEYEALLDASPFSTHEVRLVPQDRRFTRDEFAGWLTSQTLLPWTVHLPDDLRRPFTAAAVERASAAAMVGEAWAETFVRLRVDAA